MHRKYKERKCALAGRVKIKTGLRLLPASMGDPFLLYSDAGIFSSGMHRRKRRTVRIKKNSTANSSSSCNNSSCNQGWV